MNKVKRYESTIEGKRDFVTEVLSPLLVHADTGWYGAEYEQDSNKREWVWLLNLYGYRSRRIEVSGDSNRSIISDVFNDL